MGLMILFLFWGALCVWAVLRGQMLLWAAMCLVPLGAISFIWWWDHAGATGPQEDPFGLQGSQILAFVAMSLITASTGVLSLVLSGLRNAMPRAEDKEPAKPGYTLWQRLWWKPLPKPD